jgi:hypothetical protein
VNGRYHVTFPDGGDIWILYAGIANALPGQHLFVFVPADWPGEEIEEIQPDTTSRTSSSGSAPTTGRMPSRWP